VVFDGYTSTNVPVGGGFVDGISVDSRLRGIIVLPLCSAIRCFCYTL